MAQTKSFASVPNSRFIAVIVAAPIFPTVPFQPEWLITSSPQEKPKVSILEDRSGSMETQDVEISPQHVVTRTAYVQELLKGNSTESLKDTHVVEYASFGAPPAPDSPDYAMAGTDLAKPLPTSLSRRWPATLPSA